MSQKVEKKQEGKVSEIYKGQTNQKTDKILMARKEPQGQADSMICEKNLGGKYIILILLNFFKILNTKNLNEIVNLTSLGGGGGRKLGLAKCTSVHYTLSILFWMRNQTNYL